jgi:hypothetical protein
MSISAHNSIGVEHMSVTMTRNGRSWFGVRYFLLSEVPDDMLIMATDTIGILQESTANPVIHRGKDPERISKL